MREVRGDHSCVVYPPPGGGLERRVVVFGLLAERVDAGAHADIHHVPVFVGKNAVPVREIGVVEQVPSFVLGQSGRNDIGIDDEIECLEPLHDPEQVFAVFAHRPVVGWCELFEHGVVQWLESLARQVPDQSRRPQFLARPGIVQIDEIPDRRFPGSQAIDGGRVGYVNLVADRSSRPVAPEVQEAGVGVGVPGQQRKFAALLPRRPATE